MAKIKAKKQLKEKHISRIQELQWKHPGDITNEEKLELQKLLALQLKYGSRQN